jgi:hypothetical protein
MLWEWLSKISIACNEGLGSEDMSAVARCYEQWVHWINQPKVDLHVSYH